MARRKKWEAIRASERTPEKLQTLAEFMAEAKAQGDLATWRRGRAVLGYISGKSVLAMTQELDVSRAAINKWLHWYDTLGVRGLFTGKAPGSAPRLDPEQRAALVALLDAGPQAAGFDCGVWNGPMVGRLIEERFGVRYHKQHVPRLLHNLGFSVQRPRKLLARADLEAQRTWLDERLPAIKKKPPRVAASSSSRTRRASGSTARSTKRGHASASNRASRPTGCARPPTYTAP